MSKPSVSAKRILLVGDDADTCEMIRFLLEPSGYQITTADNVVDALKLAEAQGFDLYILDNWMPDGEGVELCRKLREFYPTSRFFSIQAWPKRQRFRGLRPQVRTGI